MINVFAVISDLHVGSKLFAQKEMIDFLCKAKDEAATHVLCAGDMLDGIRVYRGHEFDLALPSLDDQISMLLESLPQFGMKYVAITGNHEDSFTRACGVSAGDVIEQAALSSGRDDIEFVGSGSASIEINGVRIHIQHPGAGGQSRTTLQKTLNTTVWEQQPHLLVSGHEHTYELAIKRGTVAMKPGCFQYTTQYFLNKQLDPPAVGGVIIRIKTGRRGVEEIEHRFISYEDKRSHRRFQRIGEAA